MTGYQWLGAVICLSIVVTPIAVGIYVDRRAVWAVVWRIAVCAAIGCLFAFGLALLVGDLP